MGTEAWLRVLGPVSTADPERALPPASRRLIAALAVHPGQVVSADALVECLWPDGPPGEDGSRSLRSAVSRLRSAVGSSAIVTESPGYRLAVGPDELDAARFEALVERSRSTDGGSLAAIDEALGLWRGPAFQEYADEDWARGEAVRLEELRASATEQRLGLLAAAGRHAEVVAEARRVVDEHPYREQPRMALMRSLDAIGRQAEALRAFQDYREQMADAGLVPSPAVADLEARLVAGTEPAPTGAGAGGGTPEAPADHEAVAVGTPTDRIPAMPREGMLTVGILVTDLVGSTRLRVALGESGAEALRRDHDEALGGAVTRHRGQVVQGTGDGLLAAFHSVTDAVIAAEAVQAAAAALGVGRDHDVAVRVAVACGDVTWDGDRCFGGPVVEAMALCDLAEGGQVLCTTLVALLADSLEGLELRKVGDHDIDGVERAVGVHELARAPS